jgi:hypothetical protein
MHVLARHNSVNLMNLKITRIIGKNMILFQRDSNITFFLYWDVYILIWHGLIKINSLNSQLESWIWPRWANLVKASVFFFSLPFLSPRLGPHWDRVGWNQGLKWKFIRWWTKLKEENKKQLAHTIYTLTCEEAIALRRCVCLPPIFNSYFSWCYWNHLGKGFIQRWRVMMTRLQCGSGYPKFQL